MTTDFSKYLVCIGYPSPELIDTRFHTDLINLSTQSSSFVRVGLTNAISSNIAENRNAIVDNARMMGATHILWIDSDQTFPVNGLVRLLAHDKDIACATTCRRKGSDRSPIAVPLKDQTLTPYQKLVKMEIVGFPFMLVRMSVYDKLEKPYFAMPARKDTKITTGVSPLVGEDEYFCHAVLAAGFDIWCDMELSMEIGHIGSQVFYIQQNSIVAPPGAKIDVRLGQTPQPMQIESSAPAQQSDESYHRERDGLGE